MKTDVRAHKFFRVILDENFRFDSHIAFYAGAFSSWINANVVIFKIFKFHSLHQ